MFLDLTGCVPILEDGVYERRVTATGGCEAEVTFPDVTLTYDGEVLVQEEDDEGGGGHLSDDDTLEYHTGGDRWVSYGWSCFGGLAGGQAIDCSADAESTLELQPLSPTEYNWTIDIARKGDDCDYGWVGKAERLGDG